MTSPILPRALVWNLMVRYDHGMGCDGYYDTIFGVGEHVRRKSQLITQMTKVVSVVESYFSTSLYNLPLTPPPALLNMMSQCVPGSNETSMTQLYEEIRDYYQSHTPDVKLVPVPSPPPPSVASTDKLIRIIENLLDNSIYLSDLEFPGPYNLLTRRQKILKDALYKDIDEAEELLSQLKSQETDS